MHLSHLGMSKNFIALDIVLLHLQPFTDLLRLRIIVELGEDVSNASMCTGIMPKNNDTSLE